jgi:regulatory protein
MVAMKITKIEAQIKRPGRYSVFVDDKFAFGISELGLIDSGLRSGQEISSQELEQLKDQAQTDKIYNQVLGLIARRPRSRWEIEHYLKRKNIVPECERTVLSRLEERGLVNDEDFARRWVDSRRLLKNTSQRKLAMELKQKRVANEIIQKILAEDETDEVAVIKAEIIKKRRLSRYQDEQKLIAYLARQGYKYDDIKSALAGD